MSANLPRPIPKACVTLLRRFEGLRLRAYLDPVGIWTIGYGHTGYVNGVKVAKGMEIRSATAESLLVADASEVAAIIDGTAVHPLSDGQYGALVSFAFNLGWPALKGSTLWRLVQGGNMSAAADQFARWNKAGRPLRILAGLTKRRAAERALFLTPPAVVDAPPIIQKVVRSPARAPEPVA